jgi:hypothetical protein
MAEQVVLVCDVCNQPAMQTVQLVIGRRRLLKDYCATHLAELAANARPPRRGRAVGSSPAKGPGTGQPATTKRSAGRARSTRAGRSGRRRASASGDVGAEMKKLRKGGLSYRQIGDELLARGMKPQRAKRWNPVVIGRMLKRTA